MDIFSVITLLGGLAFFLYGMNVMSSGLEKLAGSKLEIVLKKMTSNRFKSLLLGMGITIAIQSSSALTVMLVGLVNSGIMELSQTIGVLMGSNVGTTLTAWILSLSGIEGDNIFLRMLKPESFSPIIALIGVIMIMTAKHNRTKDIGRIMVGFSVLMTGMTLMSNSVSPLADSPQFTHILTAFQNPIMGVLVGAVFTGIIQSSAASVGILQALSLTGQVTYGMAIPIIMGQNIGTCVTALLSSIGVNRSAKRVAAVHICFNCIGTLIILPVFYLLHWLIQFSIVAMAIDPVGVALVHTIFNIVTTALLLPFTKYLEKLAYFFVRDSKEEKAEKRKACHAG
ncbi:Na/Pi cotransporter family protein [Ruminococcus sp.]|uniref:Na/Pi cotransporter family protein n=1 Tax=Ruminococcus sp. TaxID=41978 RepID=UPI00399303DE